MSPVGPVRVAPKSPAEAVKPAAPPPPPPKRPRRRRGGLLSTLSALFTVILVVVMGIAALFLVVNTKANEPGPLASDKAIVIPQRSGLPDIAELLEREGVIRNPTMFRLTAMVTGAWSGLRAGEYLFKANISPREALDVLTSGRAVLHSILIPEGLTSEQIVTRLRENDLLDGEITRVPAEGALLPDTYRVERGMSRQRLLQQMADRQREELNRIWSRRVADLPIRTPQELVTLASIVEKETGRADERPRVAGVFINRLNRRMRLESDPTIVYGLVGGKGTLGRGIMRTEIRQPTPYNTYVIDGLPPGPIANPGRAAMEAVANPSRTRELFFVADGTGGHTFSETYAEHNRNVQRWRQIEAQRRAGAPVVEIDRAEPAVDQPVAPATPVSPGARPLDRRTEAPEARDAQTNPLALDPRTTPFMEATPPALAGDVETFPVPAGRRQAMQASSGQTATGAAGTLSAPQIAGAARPRVIDASEGTPRDPLRMRNFDLNSAQTVPQLRPLPEEPRRPRQ